MTSPSTPPPAAPPAEEVSLRDLYLVIVRGLPIILGLALLAGFGAFLLNANRQPVYLAESTVLVTPPPIQIGGGDNLSFSPAYEVSLQTYETLAYSQMVLENAVAQTDLTPQTLAGLGSLRQLIGPQRPDQVVPLSVVHRVRNADPELAAQLADAWAQSTLEAVRESLFASLSPVDATTAQEVARLSANVEEVEARYRAFAAEDEGPQLEAQLIALTRDLTDGRAREGQLQREIAAAEARIAALETLQAEAGTPAAADPNLTATLLELLSAQVSLRETAPPAPRLPADPYGPLREELEALFGALDVSAEEAAALAELAAAVDREASDALAEALARQGDALQRARQEEAARRFQGALVRYAVLAQASPQAPGQGDAAQGNDVQDDAAQADAAPADAVALLNSAALQTERVTLAGLEAELGALQAELEDYSEAAAELRGRLATLDQERSRLTRELDSALSAYNTVAELQASVSYLTELAPTNARILSEASVPSAPVGPRRGFNTALAAALGAVVGLVFVFLRAAVRPRTHTTVSRKVHA
ncbi:GNVR domain-containing protein [Truepera radiovictrix]|uniref:Lipopolysaccharide biosynthesis protein n=1 Tax=Truepera radiovictrix (strain DSM 17093 / CIP 108686 / LMG 22925 / RQ-24) TaxID=649638 RepID=D7CVP3_TRURR|nr:GNVR domain-containing protein [Truepera radiovictrix]ADI15954.1 lipopolysaccharide biosynthesis protein [Truepera radiovictrix DSM 17093]WMT58420.1 GNVR domain-containing protein [Truepera radiovictrix]